MKIKRWTVYDGISKTYYPKRFILRRNAQAICNSLVFDYTSYSHETPTAEELQSIQVVELY